MGGRMVTLKESQKSVQAYQSEQAAKRSMKRANPSALEVNDYVMCGRRGGQVRGVLGGDEFVVRMDDTGTNERVSGGDLERVFRSQSKGYLPGRAGRPEINEEQGS